ncbi:MAG: hypothetical protein ABFR97_01205 [Thermodesulfobacteriota bacterium]
MSTTKTSTKSRTVSREKESTSQVVGQVVTSAAGLGSLAIGLWASAALISGMIQAGGPFKLAFAWVQAVGGF